MRPRLKISPSKLEDYRVCSLGMYRKTLRDFVEGLDKPWEQTEAQAKGEAYHSILEHGGAPFKEINAKGEIQYRVADKSGLFPDWIFTEAQAEPAIFTHDNNPDKKHEVWGKLNLDLDTYDVVMHLRMDALDPRAIWDYKTTSRIPEEKTYLESLQWPIYMKAQPDKELFRYRIFRIHDNGCEQTDFLFEKNERREDYAIQWLEHLVRFIDRENLHSKFQPNT